jgi:lysophospholipase L1-like esterase
LTDEVSGRQTHLRGWRSLAVVLPLPLLLVVGLGAAQLRAERICEQQARTSALAPAWWHHGSTRAALIGDSWAVGDNENPAYPELVAKALRLDMRVSAVGGTGFVNDGACGGESFATRVSTIPRDARLIILAGGLNDTGEDGGAIAESVEHLISRARQAAPQARVVVVGVPDVPLLDTSATSRVDGILRSSSADLFLDVRDAHVSVSADDIHPSAEGQLEYADRLIAGLSE